MEATLAQVGGEARPRSHEIEPVSYIESVREFAFQATAGDLRTTTDVVRADMEAETEKSTAFVGRNYGQEMIGYVPDEVRDWITEGFSGAMARVVRTSANARDKGRPITPFGELGDSDQYSVRKQMLAEYLELCDLLSASNGRASKMVYKSAAILYHSPASAGQIISDNEDLGRSNITRTIAHRPLAAQEFAEKARTEIEAATAKFPTLPRGEIRNRVMRSPSSYEAGLVEYAESQGLALEARTVEIPEPDEFLENLRELLRTPEYRSRQGQSHPIDTHKTARQLGQEAVGLMDEAGVIDGFDDDAMQDPVLRQAFQKKVELLTLAANRAWRLGDLPVSPDQAPAEFQRELYARVLGDFLKIHVELGGSISKLPLRENPVLYFSPEEVAGVAADNSDLLPSHVRLLLLKNPSRPEEAIKEFRNKAEELLGANPRLLRHEAMRAIIRNDNVELGEVAGEETQALSPSELLGEVRAYLTKNGAHLRNNLAQDIKSEVDDLRPEAEDYFASAGWSFDGIELPESARGPLIEKIEEFIIASERAYMKNEVPGRLREYSPEERSAIYQALAGNYSRVGKLLGSTSDSEWRSNPALCIEAKDLEGLLPQYGWMTGWMVHRIVGRNGLVDVAAMLERADRTRTSLLLLYPTLPGTLVNDMAVVRPISAVQSGMSHVRKLSERDYKRTNSAVAEPDPGHPKQIYKHVRTLIKRDRVPESLFFDKQTEELMSAFKARAAKWIDRHGPEQGIDEKSLEKLLDHIEYCAAVSEGAHADNRSYPSILRLSYHAQDGFVKASFRNQDEINRLVENGNRTEASKFRVFEFGFRHDSSYLESLWKQYADYMPSNIITYAALTSPRKPIDKLNGLVEYRATLLTGNPGLSADEINKALASRASIRYRPRPIG